MFAAYKLKTIYWTKTDFHQWVFMEDQLNSGSFEKFMNSHLLVGFFNESDLNLIAQWLVE